MNYYIAKLHWVAPKEGTDEIQKFSKQFLVNSMSCTETEARIVSWIPSNYQDAVVEEVKQTKISGLHIEGVSETFWLVRLLDDNDGRSKPKPVLVVLNGLNLEEVLKSLKKLYSMEEIDMIQKFKPIIDDDLIANPVDTL